MRHMQKEFMARGLTVDDITTQRQSPHVCAFRGIMSSIRAEYRTTVFEWWCGQLEASFLVTLFFIVYGLASFTTTVNVSSMRGALTVIV
ncbi:hypothetical protein Y032_0561g3482 [Ancylostoma ceylanicum]|uniref:Uncharacterized protein n=1 Tax=Ancylostoma ceylanicum TaxID=53326 RepID=A0A016WQV5_9BILA|nr:hypothetical protein Y032_0561g3482 [Ancylostoma ceylanicum]